MNIINFTRVTLSSAAGVDWRAFVLAVGFGYTLSIFPMIIYLWRESISGSNDTFEVILFRSEIYLIFSIIAFSSVENLLGNSDKIDIFVIIGCTANIVFGILTFGFFSEFDALNRSDPVTVQNAVAFGKWCWLISLLIFSASHLRRIKV